MFRGHRADEVYDHDFSPSLCVRGSHFVHRSFVDKSWCTWSLICLSLDGPFVLGGWRVLVGYHANTKFNHPLLLISIPDVLFYKLMYIYRVVSYLCRQKGFCLHKFLPQKFAYMESLLFNYCSIG